MSDDVPQTPTEPSPAESSSGERPESGRLEQLRLLLTDPRIPQGKNEKRAIASLLGKLAKVNPYLEQPPTVAAKTPAQPGKKVVHKP